MVQKNKGEIKMTKAKRVSAPNDQDVVIFIVGMKIQQWWNIKAWGPVFSAMPPMLKELSSKKGTGFLHYEAGWNGRNIVITQYWENIKSLHDFAHGKTHMNAWTHFYKKAADSKGVGFFHETYVVKAGSYESIYVNMNKPRGLAAAYSSYATETDSTMRNRLKNV
ncbi:DUF4188 domain-containing protein [Shouchella clausii]|uniref:DUF4188 domain-containing protein n=1 Tax=Shouchella clausii TaxID=79880 RepID=A0A268P4U8_SHOCL|nr:DUF4188 domain-containing protein [Shouchella clausii]PAE90762.1 DUF4188 domain-containing protein [Shouchella clausii]PAF10852.1 DUF4188 domain-containing protein [Shouchella clausii]